MLRIASAFEAILVAAPRALAQPEARGAKLPSFIESDFRTKVEYEAWVEEIRVVDQATDVGLGGDPGPAGSIVPYAKREGLGNAGEGAGLLRRRHGGAAGHGTASAADNGGDSVPDGCG